MIELSLNEIPTEKDCINILKLIREEKGFICKKCKHTQFYWKSDKNEFECKNCKHRTSLKVDTVMHRSKLPISYWVITLDIILSNQCTVKEIQTFFNVRYQTIYNMHLTISTQLKWSTPQKRPRILSENDLTIEEKVIFLKSDYLNAQYPNQQYDWEMTKLYLEWLSQPLINFD